MNSILGTIKNLIGVSSDETAFDQDLVVGINSAIFSLMQLGVGPPEGFLISDETATWQDFIGDQKDLQSVQQYIALKTRLMFDPPSYGFVTTAIQDTIKELEWRINEQEGLHACDTGTGVPDALWRARYEMGSS